MQGKEFFKQPSGTVSVIVHRKGTYNIDTDTIEGGEILSRKTLKNLIVNNASKLMAMRMVPGDTEGHLNDNGNYIPGNVSGQRQSVGLRYLAVGTGQLESDDLPYDEITNPTTWDLQNPPSEQIETTKLAGELYRKQFTDWRFIDAFGNLAAEPTNKILLSTTFLEEEAVGPLVEMGIFGGDSANDDKDSGIMFNYKTFKVLNKENDCRISVIWLLTF